MQRRPGDQLPVAGDQLLAAVLRLALPVIQCLNAVDEHPENARLLAPVVTELVDSYDFLVAVDGYHQFDPCAWLTRYKDRIVSVLTKVYRRSASFVRFTVCYVLNTDEFEMSNQKRASQLINPRLARGSL